MVEQLLKDTTIDELKENGELLFCEDNIVSSLFNINVLSKVCSKSLPYHIAKKKCDIINSKGNIITSVLPNAYKFEMFNFDIYSYVDDVLIVRVKREDEFAPIKNKDGEDSPDTAIKLYNNKYNKKEN